MKHEKLCTTLCSHGTEFCMYVQCLTALANSKNTLIWGHSLYSCGDDLFIHVCDI